MAQGSTVADSDGTRQATLLFSPGTDAEMVLPDGTREPLTSMQVRATEYTVGASDPRPCPRPCRPPAATPTRSIQRRRGAGRRRDRRTVRRTRLSVRRELPEHPDRRERAIRLLRPAESRLGSLRERSCRRDRGRHRRMADLDTDGNGAADNDPTLGITRGSGPVSPSCTQWARVCGGSDPALHRVGLQPRDAVQGRRLRRRRTSSPRWPPAGDEDPDPTCQSGSVIECENQVLGENLGIAGTPFSLHYRSNRVPGYRAPSRSTSR